MVRSATRTQPVPNRVLDSTHRDDGDIPHRDSAAVVVPSEEMDDRTFVRHMNKRHRDSLGGLARLWETCDPYVTECYRVFHMQLHRLRLDIGHEHE